MSKEPEIDVEKGEMKALIHKASSELTKESLVGLNKISQEYEIPAYHIDTLCVAFISKLTFTMLEYLQETKNESNKLNAFKMTIAKILDIPFPEITATSNHPMPDKLNA